MEVSALTGESVKKLFLTVGELMNSVEVFLNFCWFLLTFIIATMKKSLLLLVLHACVMSFLIRGIVAQTPGIASCGIWPHPVREPEHLLHGCWFSLDSDYLITDSLLLACFTSYEPH